MSLLAVHGMTRRFGGLVAVDDVSFEVHVGAIKAIIGPNGAGKSTLFNLLTGFDRPDAGAVRFDGRVLRPGNPRAAVRAGISRTFQATQLFDPMTARENVLVALEARRNGGFARAVVRLGSGRRERLALEESGRLLRLTGVEEWADTRAADLPHGVRRTVEIARALATSPRLLLLDEPAAGLNGAETRQLGDTLYRIRDAGVTVVVVEHDMGLVMEVSDEIVVLDRGRKIAEGPPLLIQKDAAVIEAYLGEEVADDDL